MAFVEFFAASGVIALVVVEALGDVGQLGDEWAFTLYDALEREIAAFVFHDERDARQAHKMMQDVVARAMAVSPAEFSPADN
jgi:hypothetical protein